MVAWLRRLGNRCRVSKLLRIPKLPSSLHLKVLSLSELPVPSEPCFLRHCQVKRLWEARLYPNKQVNRISLYNSVLSLFLFCSPFFSPSPFFFFEFLLSFLLLGQASVRSVPSVASSLESENSESECRLFLLCFLFLPFFPYTFSPAFFFYGEGPYISTFF